MEMTVTLDAETLQAISASAAEEVLRLLRERGEVGSPSFTTAEAAHVLRTTPARIRELVRERQLTGLKEGARVLLDREEVLNLPRKQMRAAKVTT